MSFYTRVLLKERNRIVFPPVIQYSGAYSFVDNSFLKGFTEGPGRTYWVQRIGIKFLYDVNSFHCGSVIQETWGGSGGGKVCVMTGKKNVLKIVNTFTTVSARAIKLLTKRNFFLPRGFFPTSSLDHALGFSNSVSGVSFRAPDICTNSQLRAFTHTIISPVLLLL